MVHLFSKFRFSRMVLFCVLILLMVVLDVKSLETTPDPHGGIPHGVKNPSCDDNKWSLEVDWDPYGPHSSQNYTCHGPTLRPTLQDPFVYCQTKDEMNPPMHVCYPSPIHYKDHPPMSGAHRPLWPMYGEYVFLPVQRWLHALEHGAVALLYHPCADPDEVARLRKIVTNCIRKHVVTPYDLPTDQPLALVTWGCRLMMSHTNDDLAKQFIQDHAMRGRENRVVSDGQYGYFLIKPAHIVSNLRDETLCPDNPKEPPVDLDKNPKLVDELYRIPVDNVKSMLHKKNKQINRLLDKLAELKKKSLKKLKSKFLIK
ncbi:uncharacterized protein LOC121367840 isoform X2 [Gigantopelta aegis]|uniref:uncharacterized protein LOC121367840 isoform X2 n=1 Tax=Gigantopelta aegis TaxID=1735272 RepID=UPI001B887A54|nr:uncharacterized protein LOC121367840 isoform X2 [Gigantopelta aegis]